MIDIIIRLLTVGSVSLYKAQKENDSSELHSRKFFHYDFGYFIKLFLSQWDEDWTQIIQLRTA
jgi:hypothetical protein